MPRSIAIVVAVAGIVSAVTLTRALKKDPPPTPPVQEPARAPFASPIGGQGIIESIDEDVRIGAPQGGLIHEVLVKVGDRVKKDAPLLILDHRDSEAQVRTQQAQIPVLEARLKEAQSVQRDKKDQLDRSQKLQKNAVVSEDDLVRARFAFEVADAAALRAQAELESQKAQLERSRVQLDILTVKAPRDGTVLRVNVRPGEYHSVQGSNEPLMILGQVDRLQLRADIDESNATRVRADAPAFAYVKGDRETSIPLQFMRIEPYVLPKKSLTGSSTERVDTRVLQVIYQFSRPADVPLYVGQQMDVFLDGGARR